MDSDCLVLREDPLTFKVLDLCKYFQNFIKIIRIDMRPFKGFLNHNCLFWTQKKVFRPVFCTTNGSSKWEQAQTP
jgi:hypothetical protein